MAARRISSLSALGLLVVAGLALTGCSGASSEPEESAPSSSSPTSSPSPSGSEGPGGSGEQTTAEACGALSEGLDSIRTDLTDNLSNFQNDPAAASAALDEVAQTFSANVAEVTNAEISPLAVSADEALTGLTEQISAYAADPASVDTAALTDSVTALQTSFSDLGIACQ